MSELSVFSSSELELLIALPYQVGVYISYAEDEDGEEDDEREMEALEACLKEIYRSYQGQGFSAEVMKQTLSARDQWPQWEAKSFQTIQNAQMATMLLQAKVSESSAKSYKRALIEIATAVAEAYGEFGEFDEEPEEGLFGSIVSKVAKLSGMASDDANHPMNISAAEDSAIEELKAALTKP